MWPRWPLVKAEMANLAGWIMRHALTSAHQAQKTPPAGAGGVVDGVTAGQSKPFESFGHQTGQPQGDGDHACPSKAEVSFLVAAQLLCVVAQLFEHGFGALGDLFENGNARFHPPRFAPSAAGFKRRSGSCSFGVGGLG